MGSRWRRGFEDSQVCIRSGAREALHAAYSIVVCTGIVGGDQRREGRDGERPRGETALVRDEPQPPVQATDGDAELTALARLARRCDAVFGGPSDVEWAWSPAGVALLQRRPITTG